MPADVPGVTDVLDMAVVDELIALSDDGDPELLLDLIGMFLADSPTKLESMAEGIRTGDLDRVERAAHSLKGSSGNLGARELQYACESVVACSRDGDLDGARAATAKVAPLFAEARRELLRIRGQFL